MKIFLNVKCLTSTFCFVTIRTYNVGLLYNSYKFNDYDSVLSNSIPGYTTKAINTLLGQKYVDNWTFFSTCDNDKSL